MAIVPTLDKMAADPVEVAILLVRHFEGFSAKPYPCPAGIPTIGYGFTRYSTGRRVKLSDPPMHQSDAEAYLHNQLTTIAHAIKPMAPIFATRPEALAASIDFAFNLGIATFKSSTLLKRLKAEDWEGVEHEIHRWVKSKGQIIPGLVRRREAEANLFRLCHSIKPEPESFDRLGLGTKKTVPTP